MPSIAPAAVGPGSSSSSPSSAGNVVAAASELEVVPPCRSRRVKGESADLHNDTSVVLHHSPTITLSNLHACPSIDCVLAGASKEIGAGSGKLKAPKAKQVKPRPTDPNSGAPNHSDAAAAAVVAKAVVDGATGHSDAVAAVAKATGAQRLSFHEYSVLNDFLSLSYHYFTLSYG